MKKVHIFSSDMTKSQRKNIVRDFSSLFSEEGIDEDNFILSFMNNGPPDLLYHYTSLSTFQMILRRIESEETDSTINNRSNCLILRGTHIEFLNDLSEFRLAAKIMADLIKNYEVSLENDNNKHIANKLDENFWRNIATMHGLMTPPFITAFSENPDSLPMWKTYGHDCKGVAIGVEKLKIDDKTYISESGKPIWVKCSYDSERLRNIFSQGIDAIYNMFEFENNKLTIKGFPDFAQLSAYFSMLKNFAFEYEQEWRLVKNYSSQDKEKEIKFHEKDGVLKPYVEHYLPKRILKEIIIGPCSETEILENSLKMSLERAGYSVNKSDKNKDNFVNVKSSRIPYRKI